MSTITSPSPLTPTRLDDPKKFVVRRRVPVLDVHDDFEYGPVNLADLKLMVKNTNARLAAGTPALLKIGHGSGRSAATEAEVVGYARNFVVGRYEADGNPRPCALADFYLFRDRAEFALGYPHRSAERIKHEADPRFNFIENVALLRRPPRRELGMLTYQRGENYPDGIEKLHYARSFPCGAVESRTPATAPRNLRDLTESQRNYVFNAAGKAGVRDSVEAFRRFAPAAIQQCPDPRSAARQYYARGQPPGGYFSVPQREALYRLASQHGMTDFGQVAAEFGEIVRQLH